MPTSTSRLSFTDCFDLFDQALADPEGIAVGFDHPGDAKQLRLRMNAARALDREDNAETYADEPEHPLCGRSQYDEFQLKLRQAGGRTWIVIERGSLGNAEVISLSEMREALLPLEDKRATPQEVLRLTDRRI